MLEDSSGEVTRLLKDWKSGDQNALAALIPVVHQELRRLASFHLRSERPNHTLQSTALVNEAFMRLLGREPADLRNRSHFIAIASRLMRQILVDYARARAAGKRDGGHRIALDDQLDIPIMQDEELVALDMALDALARIDDRQAKIVEMKFFGGLSEPEISEVLGVSRATVTRDWSTARVWLHRQMSERRSL
jgi:RNA polymerase sigma factor (TIGR02999 family)